jgi:RNA polymerase sigma-70 factor (ECF subfamily)
MPRRTPAPAEAAASGFDFAGLVRQHQAMVFSIAWHLLRDRAVAEELAQDVFLSLHQHLAEMESPEHVIYWLRRVTTNRALDETRRRQRRPMVSLENAPEPVAVTPTGDPLLDTSLRKLVAALPEKARAIVVLRYQEDLDPAEIARVLGIPVGTVKSQLQRALALLREKLSRVAGQASGLSFGKE